MTRNRRFVQEIDRGNFYSIRAVYNGFSIVYRNKASFSLKPAGKYSSSFTKVVQRMEEKLLKV